VTARHAKVRFTAFGTDNVSVHLDNR
jgi:hypothetical protein